VTIGAVDCAKNENNPLCRDMEIMSYPTIRVFPPLAKAGDMGTDLQAEKTLESIENSLLEFLEKEQIEGRGTNTWPTLIPYRCVQNFMLTQLLFFPQIHSIFKPIAVSVTPNYNLMDLFVITIIFYL
jgi:hypothetical protein